jgi:hypothetical protein
MQIEYKKPYKLLKGGLKHLGKQDKDGPKIGDTVYRCSGHDYGCARDDTSVSGEQYVSMTLNADGSYPFFTVPVRCLKESVTIKEIMNKEEFLNKLNELTKKFGEEYQVEVIVNRREGTYRIIDVLTVL